MSHLQAFQVFPLLPEPLSFLEVLSRNLWWCWNIDAIELFRRINPRLWNKSGRNPIVFLTLIPQQRLKELSHDESFLAHQQRVEERFANQVSSPVDHSNSSYGSNEAIAYFSMEYGLHESLPIFAGGLGVLAGDHLKAASDLAIPLVAVGLLYRQGYFHQFLDQEGWQQEEYPEIDLYQLPVQSVKDPSGKVFQLAISGPDGDINFIVWKVMVGRIPYFLLDTNLPENPPITRDITSHLYAGEQKQRLAQEMLLGIGGMRALEAMGIHPLVCHMNEGHSAFASLERVAQTMSRHNVDLKTALEIVPRTTVFTTHTPVAAGHDEFPPDLVRPYLVPFEERLGVNLKRIVSWGQSVKTGPDGPFSMFVLGLRLAQHRNAVSELHGKVARRMWRHVWPGVPEDEIPIDHVTNGIHIASWISIENALLFERYIGPDWNLRSCNKDFENRIDQIYDEELWRAREMSRSRLIRTCRELMVRQYARRNAPKAVMEDAESVLDPDVLTIAFARRFATYKRAGLLLRDPERLEALLGSKTRPVQFIFSGKAHPKDNEGKEMIKRLIQFARKQGARHRVIFVENYDIYVARHLVQGADVWLNTPRRPMEACGTSGMKAAVNGVLNVSILDGWWNEGYSQERGWKIGNGEEYPDTDYQDSIDSQALYNVLENDVIPSFYDRKNGDVPERWVRMMKESMKMAMAFFSARLMVKKYEKEFYLPAIQLHHSLLADYAQAARQRVSQNERIHALWKNIRIEAPKRDAEGPFRVGETFQVTSEVGLGELRPDEVEVELYHGNLKSVDILTEGQVEKMMVREDRGNGNMLYGCTLACQESGRYGFTVRITPRGDGWLRFIPGLITWA
jgi:starch phosphorylase